MNRTFYVYEHAAASFHHTGRVHSNEEKAKMMSAAISAATKISIKKRERRKNGTFGGTRETASCEK